MFSQDDGVPPCGSSLNPFYSRKKIRLTVSSYFPTVSFKLMIEKIFTQLWLNLWKTHTCIAKKKKEECLEVALAGGTGRGGTDDVRSHEETKCRVVMAPQRMQSWEIKSFKPGRLAIHKWAAFMCLVWPLWGFSDYLSIAGLRESQKCSCLSWPAPRPPSEYSGAWEISMVSFEPGQCKANLSFTNITLRSSSKARVLT